MTTKRENAAVVQIMMLMMLMVMLGITDASLRIAVDASDDDEPDAYIPEPWRINECKHPNKRPSTDFLANK